MPELAENTASSSGSQQATAAAASPAEPQAAPAEQAADQEDPNECGWCKWMKAGGCKAEFDVWLKCVDGVRDEGREDVESCASVMGPLWECMERNKEYYEVQLEALKGRPPSVDEAEASQERGASESKEAKAGLMEELGSELAEAVEAVLGDLGEADDS